MSTAITVSIAGAVLLVVAGSATARPVADCRRARSAAEENLLPGVEGLRGPFSCPQQRALRDRLGLVGCGRVPLARRAQSRKPERIRACCTTEVPAPMW
jgi:hypothetical protein